MKHLLMSSAALAVAIAAAPAIAASPTPAAQAPMAPAATAQPPMNEPHTAAPVVTHASNIDTANTKSDVAPALPNPPVGPDAEPQIYLHTAARDLSARRTGAAQQALEMAETRLLDRGVPADSVGTPDRDPAVAHVSTALHELANNNIIAAQQEIDAALTHLNQPNAPTKS